MLTEATMMDLADAANCDPAIGDFHPVQSLGFPVDHRP
jgi:hypothetical protein